MPRRRTNPAPIARNNFVPVPAGGLPEHTNNQISVCLSQEWIPVIVGALKPFMHIWAWQGDYEDRIFAKEEMLAIINDLEEACMSCCTDVNGIAEMLSKQQLAVWDGAATPQDIHPLIPDLTWTKATGDLTGDERLRKIALCNACKIFIDYICRIINGYLDQAGNLLSVISGIGLVIVGAAAAFLSAGAALPLVYAMIAGIANAGVHAFDFWVSAICDDEDIKWDAACFLYNYLKNITITQPHFEGAFDAGGSPVGSDAEKILAGVKVIGGSNWNHIYEAFLNILGEATRAAKAEIIVDCPCLSTEYCDEMTTGLGDMSFEISASLPFAHWNVGTPSGDGQIGGNWADGYGRDALGGIASAPDGGGKRIAAVVVDLGAEKTVKRASFYHRENQLDSQSTLISFRSASGAEIDLVVWGSDASTNFLFREWEGSLDGVRYVVFESDVNDNGTDTRLDDICVGYED